MPSRRKRLPTGVFSPVNAPNLPAPRSFNRNETAGPPVLSSVVAAKSRSSPVTSVRGSTIINASTESMPFWLR